MCEVASIYSQLTGSVCDHIILSPSQSLTFIPLKSSLYGLPSIQEFAGPSMSAKRSTSFASHMESPAATVSVRCTLSLNTAYVGDKNNYEII